MNNDAELYASLRLTSTRTTLRPQSNALPAGGFARNGQPAKGAAAADYVQFYSPANTMHIGAHTCRLFQVIGSNTREVVAWFPGHCQTIVMSLPLAPALCVRRPTIVVQITEIPHRR